MLYSNVADILLVVEEENHLVLCLCCVCLEKNLVTGLINQLLLTSVLRHNRIYILSRLAFRILDLCVCANTLLAHAPNVRLATAIVVGNAATVVIV